MSNFLTSIHVNKIFHLENIDIPIDANEKRHLIITGKNGSGKTSLLNALVEFFQDVIRDKQLTFLDFEKNLKIFEGELDNSSDKKKDQFSAFKKSVEGTYGKIILKFNDLEEISRKLQGGNFLVAFYAAYRKTKVAVPITPEKPNLNPVLEITDSKQSEFVKFLVDLKIQEALARNENEIKIGRASCRVRV